jgi:sugar transferase (PEP-CTERM/EpsH1 system associated)
MNLLYLSQRLPFPPDRGDRIATFNHIRYLARGHRVFVASLIQSAGEMKHINEIEKIAVKASVERQGRIAAAWGMGMALLKNQPLSIGYFCNARLRCEIAKLIRDYKIEAAIAFSSSMAQYLEPYNRLLRVIYFCDVDSQKWLDLSKKCGGLKSWIYRREARLLLEYEKKIARSFSASCVVAEGEAQLFRRLIPGAQVDVVENGVDFDYFGSLSRQSSNMELVFVGVMNYPPNEEAVQYFVREIWPLLLARMPSLHFTIVGSHPTKAVRALAGVPGVTVTGYVNDVRPYFARAALAVAPLAIARGIQNKILEAMAAGIPVLTTPTVAGNLPAEVRALIDVEERQPEKFANAVLRVLDNPDKCMERSRRAMDFIHKRYSWESKIRRLEELIASHQRDNSTVEGARCAV